MNEYIYTTADLCLELGIGRKLLRRQAAALGLGINLRGPRGYRYSEADRQALTAALIESMRPAQRAA